MQRTFYFGSRQVRGTNFKKLRRNSKTKHKVIHHHKYLRTKGLKYEIVNLIAEVYNLPLQTDTMPDYCEIPVQSHLRKGLKEGRRGPGNFSIVCLASIPDKRAAKRSVIKEGTVNK